MSSPRETITIAEMLTRRLKGNKGSSSNRAIKTIKALNASNAKIASKLHRVAKNARVMSRPAIRQRPVTNIRRHRAVMATAVVRIATKAARKASLQVHVQTEVELTAVLNRELRAEETVRAGARQVQGQTVRAAKQFEL